MKIRNYIPGLFLAGILTSAGCERPLNKGEFNMKADLTQHLSNEIESRGTNTGFEIKNIKGEEGKGYQVTISFTCNGKEQERAFQLPPKADLREKIAPEIVDLFLTKCGQH